MIKNIQFNFFDYDITVSEIEYIYNKKRPFGFTCTRNSNDFCTMAYILSGSADYYFSDKTYTVKKGNIIFLNKNSIYKLRVTSKEDWEHIVISFKITNPNDIKNLPFETVNTITHNQRFVELFKEIYNVWSNCSTGYKIQAKALTTQIIYELICENLKQTFGSCSEYNTFEKVIKYIEQNYNKKITVEELAKITGYSASHFTRVFLKIYGISPITYLNHLRITHAKNLLKANQHSIEQIAIKCGFSNVYYFSRYFKQITGTTPKKF